MPPIAQESLSPAMNSTTRIHEIYIKAAPAAIWDALTTPEWTAQYGYRGLSEYELKPGGRFTCKANAQMRSLGLPEVIVDGEVIEANPPYKLVQTYRFLFNDAHHLGNHADRKGLLPPHRHARYGRRADDVRRDEQQVRPEGRRRMELDSQRSQVAAGNRQADVVRDERGPQRHAGNPARFPA
jgi:Activator of Hsp90 ATPase homolog 1-like protein